MNQDPSRGRPPGRRDPKPLRRLKALLATLVVGLVGAAFALDGAEDQTILQGLQNAPDQFGTFLELVESAGLTDALQGEGPITLLAPSDAAFDDLGEETLGQLRAAPEQLAEFVNGLILSGAYSLQELQDAAQGALVPVSGEAYVVETTSGGLTVNQVGFEPTDVDNVFSNGVVHVTRGVILPPALRQAADEAAAEGADAAADGTDAAEDANAAEGAADDTADDAGAPAPVVPATPPAADQQPDTAFVRVVQLSPATSVDVVLTPTEEGLAPVELAGLEYAAAPDYQAVTPGSYLVNATLAGSQDALFDPPTETFRAGDHYTVTISGLQVPGDDAAEAEAEGEGFGAWLRDLFGGGGDRDGLALRAVTYQDEVRDDATGHRVRVVNAAPGSPAFDVVAIDAAGERHVLADGISFGDAVGPTDLVEDLTALQVTAAGSEVVAVDLSGQLPLPTDATLFITGTTFEGAPLDVLVLPNGAGAATDATRAQ